MPLRNQLREWLKRGTNGIPAEDATAVSIISEYANGVRVGVDGW